MITGSRRRSRGVRLLKPRRIKRRTHQISAYRYGVYDGRVPVGDVEAAAAGQSVPSAGRWRAWCGANPGFCTRLLRPVGCRPGSAVPVRWGVMRVNGIGRLRRHPMLGLAAVVWLVGWLLILGAHSTMASAQAMPAPHAAHVLPMSVGDEFTLNVDHPHADKGYPSAHPERFATAVLPRSAPGAEALVGLGVLAAVALIGWRSEREAASGRGPPRGLGPYLSGQDRLTRFCLSRR